MQKVCVSLPILLTSCCVDDEVQAVLEPIQAEETQVDVGFYQLIVDNVHERDRGDEQKVAEAHQKQGACHSQVPLVKSFSQLGPIKGYMFRQCREIALGKSYGYPDFFRYFPAVQAYHQIMT